MLCAQGAVTVLCYARQGAMLVSGSQDTTVVVWDPVAEAPLFSLKGHKDQVTALVRSVLHTAGHYLYMGTTCGGGFAKMRKCKKCENA